MPSPEPSPPKVVLSEAKLAPPRPRANMLPRPRLFAELDRLEDASLTLVSAPAGSGKTVLVASWLDHRPDRVAAWVTLELGDDEPSRLWTAVGTAVDRLRPGIARPALSLLRTPRCLIEDVIDELLNGLAGYDGSAVIVLDDLHHVTAPDGLTSLAYAVERLPRTTRMVATTRSDPAIRLGRLRAKGELGELRARDLAFTSEELGAFLRAQGVTPLEREDVDLLIQRTEGWPAGVGLASMWLARADAPRQNLREFSASNRHVTDYLTSEVLDMLDVDTRRFLLETSVLDRFTADTCDAVRAAGDSAERLEALARSNLFLVALDGRGEWYRYHHLFRELLLAELATTDSEAPAALHRRAAAWFGEHDLLEEALKHTEATGDQGALADLLLAQQMNLIRSGMLDTLTSWLERVSEAELSARPQLAAAGALSSGMVAQPANVRRRYAALAEKGAEDAPEPVRQFVRAVAGITRGGLLDGDLDASIAEAHVAADLARRYVGDLLVPALGVLAYALYLGGADAQSRAAADEVLALPGAEKHPHGLVFAHGVHALLEADATRGHTAVNEARDAVAVARALGISGTVSAGIAHHALGEALLAVGQPQEAEREMQRAVELRRASEPRLDSIHSLIQLARARLARGRLALAETTLGQAQEQLTAFSDAGRLTEMAAAVHQLLKQALAENRGVAEPPTPAELAILQLLATDLSQREIGSELYLSLNTVKTHSRNLYVKLGAHSREEATQKAHMLGLIEPSVQSSQAS